MRSNAARRTAARPATRQTARQAAARRPVPRPIEQTATRVVNDRRWVHGNQLELGMYVAELDRPWIETRFMFQGFRIDSFETLRAVQDACEYACVETQKLARVSTASVHRMVGPSARA